ncbi:hypothetical protein DEO72_LG9g1167 [Vigna unguiculata]|uniref:Uncharacterized protein n=1 Tax=Vigna unguiculata TaxID=3917 RepID=A0A4D6MXI8_VIGUN|nr:hypothetical protein DEO72_LG9g1167 [Vigna unguiculata]
MVRMGKGCQTGLETGDAQYCHGAWLWNGDRQAIARIQWGSGLDGAWRLEGLCQAATTRTMAPGTASAWRCRLSRQAVWKLWRLAGLSTYIPRVELGMASLEGLCQAATTRTGAPGTASAWRCRRSRQAVWKLWRLAGVLQGFWWCFKGRIAEFLELSSERIPWVELGIGGLCQAATTRTGAPGTASAWRCRRSRQAVWKLWRLAGVLQGFWWCFKGRIAEFLELSSERIPWVELGIGVKHVHSSR